MRSLPSSRLLAVATLAVGLVVIWALAGVAQGAGPAPPPTATIEIKGAASKPRFVVPDGGIAAGGQLTIDDQTSGFAGHTFSLVKKSALPDTRSEKNSCQRRGHICNAIKKKWHGGSVDPVDAGNPGWDTEGDTKHKGDSSFLFSTSDTRTVTAAPGTLHFMCAIHPKTMQGTIHVRVLKH